MKRLLLVIFAVALFTSSVLESNIASVNAAATTQKTLQNYRLFSDGGGSTPSIHWDGTKFTLTENIEGTITIESNNTVLDGAGFTVRGKGEAVGVAAYDKYNVIIKNVKLENFQTGILLGHYSPDAFLWYDPNPNRPTDCAISNCQVSNNTNGISISGGIKCRITGNQATNNMKGITFFGSENVFRNNQMRNNSINFVDMTYEKSDVDSSNTVDSKPVYYFVNQKNMKVPADAGMVHLEGCSNIMVQNLDLKYAYVAISLFNSSNCKIYGNTVTNGEIGISLRNSTNNSIIGNKLHSNSNDAIEQYDSENTTIANNLIRANGGGIDSTGYGAVGSRNAVISSNQIIENSGCGIQAGTECTITGNYIEGNAQHGIYFWDTSNSIIYKNTITQNRDSGICFRISKNASITGNDISKNNVGISMGDSSSTISSCTITENIFDQNTNLAIRIDGDAKDNKFYLNNFMQNNKGSLQVTIKGIWVYKGDEGYNENSEVFPQYYARYNEWDNGTAGNYWSNYNSNSDAYYRIDVNNQDNHPLLTPLEFRALELPSTNPPQEENQTNSQTWSEAFPMYTGVTVFVLAIVITCAALAVFIRKKRR